MCGTASVWAKLALGCIVLGMTLHIAGWASMYWMVYETSGSVLQTFIGLWRQKTCQNNVCTEDAVDKYVTGEEATEKIPLTELNGSRNSECKWFTVLVVRTSEPYFVYAQIN